MTKQTVSTANETVAPEDMSIDQLADHLKEMGFSMAAIEQAVKAEKKKAKKQSTRKFDAIDYTSLVMTFEDDSLEDAWDMSKGHVNMPIKVVPGNVVLNEGDEPIATEYDTDTGRYGTFHFVMIDRNRDGVWKALSPVSEMYAAIKPNLIYENLQQTLDSIKADYHIRSCYNSYSGGEQRLSIEIKALDGFGSNDKTTMELVLITSLDRSKKHTLVAQPLINGKPIYFVDTGSNQFNLATRHVQSAAEKVVDFNASIAAIVENWNTKIVPYTMFLCEDGFSEKEVFALLSGIVKDAKLPDSLVDRMPLVKQNACGTLPIDGIQQICATIEDDASLSPMAKAKHAEKIGKAIADRVSKLFERKSK